MTSSAGGGCCAGTGCRTVCISATSAGFSAGGGSSVIASMAEMAAGEMAATCGAATRFKEGAALPLSRTSTGVTASGTGTGAAVCAGAFGSQAGHSFTAGGISRPHSGQIQWNMPPMYTHPLLTPVRDKPYGENRGTLDGSGFRLRPSPDLSGICVLVRGGSTYSPAAPQKDTGRRGDQNHRRVHRVAIYYCDDFPPVFPQKIS